VRRIAKFSYAIIEPEGTMIALDNRVALVTGAARGIGRACAKMLAQAGARVAVNYRAAKEQASTLLDEIRKAGGEAQAYRADVSERAEVDRMIEAVRRDFGPVDILVANAGIYPAESGPAEELSEESWGHTLDVNLTGMWHCCRAVIPDMKKRRSGRIVLISSVSALTGEALGAGYAVSKGGVISLGASLAQDLGPYGVIVNCISPGWVDTDMTANGLVGEEREKAARQTSVRRIGTPEEIAGPVLFLASDLATYISGQNLVVDGGEAPAWT
jgi:3-oxoacyl-[acyl-carrier protein] reductase